MHAVPLLVQNPGDATEQNINKVTGQGLTTSHSSYFGDESIDRNGNHKLN